MRVVIAAVGSRGDVAPYTGVGVALRAAGHDVVIAAHAPFEHLVRHCGLEFHPVPGDVRALVALSSGRPPSSLFWIRRARFITNYLSQAATGVLAAAESADLLALNGTATFGYDIAEALDIPSLGLFAQPLEPTGAFPPVAAGHARSLGSAGNLVSAKVVEHALFPFHRAAARLRRQLGLRPRSLAATLRRVRAQDWPILHGFSPAVLPRPPDWRPGLQVVGYWWPVRPAGWQPPSELLDFLAAGPPPVFVGFGSMAAGAQSWLGELVAQALSAAGVRGIVQAGWAGLAASAGADVLGVGDIPHDWLFPQMAALVHHAGAGTTAAGLRAGVPAIGVPVIADQPLWARRIGDLGVGPAAIPLRRLNANRLAHAIRAAVSGHEYRRHAQALATRLEREDGAAAVVAAVDRLAADGPHTRPG
jgi:UDP:flavonoid glycosyltransferase YjiC (YdhE family)